MVHANSAADAVDDGEDDGRFLSGGSLSADCCYCCCKRSVEVEVNVVQRGTGSN